MNKLQKALTLNAIFSLLSGIVLILFNQNMGKLFATENNTVFWIIGIALIYFSITIGLEIKKQRKSFIIWIVIQDMLWVLGSIFLLIAKPFSISFNGNITIGTVALIVLFMAVN